MDKYTIVLAGCGLLSFIIAAVLGKWLIPWLRKLKFGQTILEDGPKWHQKKQGTPTMGGILFILGFIVAIAAAMVALCVLDVPLLPSAYAHVRFWGGIGLAIGCGLIGFLDDYIKVVKKQNKGLSASQKLFLQLLLSVAYAVLLYWFGNGSFNIAFGCEKWNGDVYAVGA